MRRSKAEKRYSIDELKERLKPLIEQCEADLVVLFGSRAKKLETAGSDVDLAFLCEKPLNLLKMNNEIISLLHINDVDVIDLKRTNPLLMAAIAQGGKIIYEKKPGIFNSFYSLAIRKFMDTKKLRKLDRIKVEKFIKEREK